MVSVEVGEPERARELLALVEEWVKDSPGTLLANCHELIFDINSQLDEAHPEFKPCPICGVVGDKPCIPRWEFGETDGVWHEERIDRSALMTHIEAPPLPIDCPTCWSGAGTECIRGRAGTPLWEKELLLGRNHDQRVISYRKAVVSNELD
jgi:hypothetical protein